MIRVGVENGYKLVSEIGFDLVVLIDSVPNFRSKEVFIPITGTLLEWVEVPEEMITL